GRDIGDAFRYVMSMRFRIWLVGLLITAGLQLGFAEDIALQESTKSAESGVSADQYFLGVKYDHGLGVEKNLAEAARWYRKAAERGFPAAQTCLGVMYENGRGVEKDDAEAVKWYRKAAEQGDDLAQTCLGLMYLNGQGVEDDTEAMKWFRKAA